MESALIGSQTFLNFNFNCVNEGFNVKSSLNVNSKARIGFLGYRKDDFLHNYYLRIGFGTGGKFAESTTCGIEDRIVNNVKLGVNEESIKAIGYILVQ